MPFWQYSLKIGRLTQFLQPSRCSTHACAKLDFAHSYNAWTMKHTWHSKPSLPSKILTSNLHHHMFIAIMLLNRLCTQSITIL